MKKIITTLMITAMVSQVHAREYKKYDYTKYYNDVKSAWPSPTPDLQNRFIEYLDCLPKNAVVAEVGVQEGTFSKFIFERTNPSELVLIDCWEHQDPRVFDDLDANVEQVEQDRLYKGVCDQFASNPEVKVLKAYSADAVAQYPDEYFDWVYIDSNHCYDAVKEDLRIWYPKVKSGGFICGHDYLAFEREGFGITQALNEFMRDHGLGLAFRTEGDRHESWAVRKP